MMCACNKSLNPQFVGIRCKKNSFKHILLLLLVPFFFILNILLTCVGKPVYFIDDGVD